MYKLYKISNSETELNILRIKICHRLSKVDITGIQQALSEHLSSKGFHKIHHQWKLMIQFLMDASNFGMLSKNTVDSI